MNSALVTSGLGKSYSGTWALRDAVDEGHGTR